MKRKAPMDAPLRVPMEPHLDIVEREALRWRGATTEHPIDLDDLRQAGRLGLWRACQLHERDDGFRVFARIRVRAAIKLFIENECASVRRPYRGERGAPSNLNTCRSIQQRMGGSALTMEETMAADTPEPDELMEEAERLRALSLGLESLNERTRRVMRNSLSGLSLVESGRALGVCRERARQLQADGIKRVRAAMGAS